MNRIKALVICYDKQNVLLVCHHPIPSCPILIHSACERAAVPKLAWKSPLIPESARDGRAPGSAAIAWSCPMPLQEFHGTGGRLFLPERAEAYAKAELPLNTFEHQAVRKPSGSCPRRTLNEKHPEVHCTGI